MITHTGVALGNQSSAYEIAFYLRGKIPYCNMFKIYNMSQTLLLGIIVELLFIDIYQNKRIDGAP